MSTRMQASAGRKEPGAQEFEVTLVIDPAPLKRLPLRVGPFQVIQGMLSLADDGAKQYIQRRFGPDFKEDWFSKGFPALVLRVWAVDHNEAVRTAFDLGNVVADFLVLGLGISYAAFDLAPDTPLRVLSGVFVRRVDEAEPKLYRYHREVLGYINTDGQVAVQRQAFDTATLPKLTEKIPPSVFREEPTEVQLRLRRAIHWAAQSRRARPLASRFLLSWTALESLTASPQDKRRKKGEIVRTRLAQLVLKHGWQGAPEQLLNRLWLLRHQLVHEAVTGYFDAEAGHAREIGSLLWATHYFFLLALILAIDSCETASSIVDMWGRVADYSPSIILSPDELPVRHLFVEWMEGEEGDFQQLSNFQRPC